MWFENIERINFMNELNYKEIGKRIKSKRLELKLTQEKLSEIIDVSPTYISEIERGGSICSLYTISKIASTLNTSLDFLVFGIVPKNSDYTFSELLQTIPQENRTLYINLCENIANSLK